MSAAVSCWRTLETQTSDSVRRGPGGFSLFSYDDKRGDKLLRVLSVSPVNGRHLWAPCLSGRSLGAQRVLRPAAGTDTPRSASKGPIGREPSPFIVGGDGEVFVSEPRYRHVPVTRLLPTTAPAEQLLPCSVSSTPSLCPQPSIEGSVQCRSAGVN